MQFLRGNHIKEYSISTKASCLSHYTPFGSPMPTRVWSDPNSKYKYGFNGKEKDNETTVDGGDYDFGARIYDSRLGRWLSLDPESGEYPSHSGFHFAYNSPLICVDIDGKRIMIQYQVPVLDVNGNAEFYANGEQKYYVKFYEYGSKLTPPDDEFVKSTIESLDYVCKSRAGRRQVEKAMKDNEYLQIVQGVENLTKVIATVSVKYVNKEGKEVEEDIPLLDDKNGYIFINQIEFNPKNKAILYYYDRKNHKYMRTGGTQSAAVILIHEIKHWNNARKNLDRYFRKSEKRDKKYDYKEERRVIRFERRVARQLGDGIRYNHKGKNTSNTGVKEHDDVPKNVDKSGVIRENNK